MATIARYLNMEHLFLDLTELVLPDKLTIEKELNNHPEVTHVVMVHCETTTGILNPIEAIAEVVKRNKRVFIVDAMSSFGGIPIDMEQIGIDFLISSANKCIQGVPGFGFVIARKELLEKSKGFSRSYSLDIYDQWETMEKNNGKWRFTSATHTVRAFAQALEELEIEGGIFARFARYTKNQRQLVDGMRALGFKPLLPDEFQSPIITTFISPDEPWFSFDKFYHALKAKGFVIYPGKVTNFDCFRIGNIGEIYLSDIIRLIEKVKEAISELS